MKDIMFVYHSVKTACLGKIWFSRFLGKKGKSGRGSRVFWLFRIILSLFCSGNDVNCRILWFSIILRKPHVCEKIVSSVLARKTPGQSDCSIFQISISQEWLDRLSWFFVWWCNTIRGRKCTYYCGN